MRSWLLLAAVLAGCGPAPDHCEGNVAVRCGTDEWSAESCDREDCGAEFCVESALDLREEPVVLCSPERETRPECLDAELQARSNLYRICVGPDHVVCSFGYAINVIECGSPDLCHEFFDDSGDRNVSCILSTTRHPKCPLGGNYASGMISVCDGSLALTCFDGYLTRMEDCTAQSLPCDQGYCR